LHKARLNVKMVIAAPKLDLQSKKTVEYVPAVKIKEVCQAWGVSYLQLNHDDCMSIAQSVYSQSCNLGVIAGARELNPDIISLFDHGIINYHPGKLPETAGLNALEWSVLLGLPPYVTAHLINDRLDEGSLLLELPLAVYPTDTIDEIKARLLRYQVFINYFVVSR